MALFGSIHAQTLPAYLPTNGLVGWWPFNGNANDESGNGNNGTVNGATLTADRNGNSNRAYSFDGLDDFIQAFNTLTGNEEITMIVWAKLTSDHAGQFVHLGLDQVGCPCNGIGLGYGGSQSNNSGSNLLGLSSGINWINTNYSIDISGTWQMLTLIKDVNNNFNFYSNGQLVFSSSSSINSASNSIFFGSASPTYSLLQGSLDDIAIYNRALTQEEITALYNGTTNTPIAGCTNNTACNYNSSATQDDGSCTYPAQTYLNCAGTCINDADNDGTCDELETPALPSYLPSNGLVGYWPFNGNANDESGNGNHGTVNGATLTVDRDGNANSAYSFDGVNDNIIIASDEILNVGTSDFSISIFFRSENLTNAYLIGKRSYSLGNGYSIFLQNNALYGQLIDENSASQSPGCNFNTTENQWHHYVVTFDRDNNQLAYMDGIFCDYVGILDESGNIVNETDLFIGFFQPPGNDCWTGCYFFNGQLDDIAIYNRALTQEEITALYNGTTTISGCTNNTACNYNASATQDDGSCTFPTQTYLNCDGSCINDANTDGTCDEVEATFPSYLPANGLVAWYPFNGNANDESGNGNNGTINGATLTSDRNGNANSAYSFDGVDNQIDANNTSNIAIASNSANTISIWFISNGNNYGSLLSFTSDIPGDMSYRIQLVHETNGNITFNGAQYSGLPNPPYVQVSCPNITLNTWNNIVVTHENSLVKIFLNSELINSNQYTGPIAPVAQSMNLHFGYIPNEPQERFAGTIDDIAIYNRALTPSEITALYTGTSSNNNGGGGTAGTPAASVPAGIPYQAVIRDNAGAALVNAPVSVRFTLHQNTTDGTVEYQETQSLTTNAIGLINTQFGSGTATQGTFANINWSNTTKFIQVEANTGNGFVDMGTQQMMSVPFAIKSNESNKIKNAGLPVYSDNAAAVAGGLTPGEMYRTANGDLKIVF